MKRDVFKLDPSFQRVPDSSARRLRRRVHHDTEHTDRKCDLLVFMNQPDHLHQRPGHSVRKHLKRNRAPMLMAWLKTRCAPYQITQIVIIISRTWLMLWAVMEILPTRK